MSFYDALLHNLPEVSKPHDRLTFKTKLLWTLSVLVIFFTLQLIPLFGLGSNALQTFELLSIILGAEFGSLISLGIGPIVTASIILQLLNGAGIVKFDLQSHAGKARFQGTQKLLSIFFILFESGIYVFFGGLAPSPELQGLPIYFILELVLIIQMFVGGLLIMFMDEISSKWGFGSGLSLFIAAGVSKSLFIRTFSPLPSPNNPEIATGAIPALVQSLLAGDPQTALLMLSAVVATVAIFCIAVYVQSMKVELPLSFGRVRGFGIRWPLNFMYTSNIPVILVAAMLANIQLWARLLQNAGYPILGTFSGNAPQSGLVSWIAAPSLIPTIIKQGSLFIGFQPYFNALVYVFILMAGAVVFGYFWVQTAGMDARSQAKNIMNSGLQIPGFRKDERILESILNRYINPLTVMGALTVGLLAGLADISGALTNGTGLLLTVMIIYKLYEDVAKQHMMDMNPAMRKFMGGN
ncbi:MAG TPA: preprotein translocase subunit SecY [Candidatus Nanoarchaeia archaeon]|nr:preprotein translocase subunit SecY [Candidatus Nanoarchaeia archaeon]